MIALERFTNDHGVIVILQFEGNPENLRDKELTEIVVRKVKKFNGEILWSNECGIHYINDVEIAENIYLKNINLNDDLSVMNCTVTL